MYRKNVASQNLPFVLIKASDGTALTGATVTARRSIDGGAQANCTGTVSELANGQYNLALSQADTNGNNIGILLTAASAIPVHFSLVTTAADPTDSVRLGLTSLANAAAGAAGGMITAGATGNVLPTDAIAAASIASNAITSAKIATDAIGAAQIAADAIGSSELATTAVTEIQAAVAAGAVASVTGAVGSIGTGGITAASFASGAIDAAAIATDAIGSAELAASAVTEIQSGLATAANQTTILANIATVQTDTDDIQTRLPAALVGGRIDASVGAMATDVITSTAIATDAIGSAELAASAVTEIQSGLATSANQTTILSNIAAVQADTDDIQGRLPAALVAGRIDASVGAMAADVVTASAIATDAIGSAELAASAVTEIQSGLATAASIAALNDLSAAEVNAEVVDVLTVDQCPEVTAVPSSTATIAQMICWVYALARNRILQSNSQQTLKADNDTTTIAVANVSDNGTTATREKWT